MSYIPEPVPREGLEEYLERELRRISAEFHKQHDFDVLHAEPDKLYEGMVRYADGSDWQASAGLYYYNGSTWTKL